jgi:uncharacterized delta-60 repeat protein
MAIGVRHPCLLALAVVAVATVPAHAASLDPSFGNDGRVVLDFGPTVGALAGSVAVQPDGKIIGAGWIAGAFGVVRLQPDGALDTGFGTGGVVLPSFGALQTSRTPAALALQPDGAILVAGPGTTPGIASGTDFALMRLLPDGNLDPAFGQAGKAVLQVGTDTGIPEAIALEPDGKIVVAGYAYQAPGTNGDMVVVRLTPTGRFDTGFGTGGIEFIPMPVDSSLESASAVAVAPDGKVVVAGVTARPDTGFDLAVARLTSGGQLDPGFGDSGRSVVALGTGAWQEVVNSLALGPDGSIDVGGADLQPGFGPSHVALTRFTAAGALDPTFASAGQFVHAIGSTEDTSHGIVIDGSTTYLAVDSRSSIARQIGVVALDPHGQLDSAFADGGTFLFHVTAGGDDRVAAIARRSDGALVEFATVRAANGPNDTFGFAVVEPHSTQAIAPPPPPDESAPVQNVAPTSRVTAPRNGQKLRRVTLVTGTAAAGPLGVGSVDVALVRLAHGARAATARPQCSYLVSSAPRFTTARPRGRAHICTALLWKRARGTARWSFKLRRSLPSGSYVVYSRATAGGFTEPRRAANRIAFVVR